jgi:hypothetical protein
MGINNEMKAQLLVKVKVKTTRRALSFLITGGPKTHRMGDRVHFDFWVRSWAHTDLARAGQE